ncbi:uncharacterized protein TNCV_5023141 [Trichonephila clavipes]|nr:uncharacterized protein TNCV_5023141 [Trichonephila clavipes]
MKQHHSMGYSTKLELLCESCHGSYGSGFSSFQEAKNSHDINSKLVSAFLSIGRGHAALETFFICAQHANNGPKNICQMHAQLIREKQRGEEKKMLEMSRQAAREVTGLVLDFEVLSKYCQNCVFAGRDMGVDSAEFHIWQKGHADECDKNFDRTSGAMEMHAALIMWRRSISDCQMRFVSMLSDGDSKLFNFVGQ